MKLGDLTKNVIVPAISVVTAAMVAWLNHSVSERDLKIQQELGKINAQVSLNREERDRRLREDGGDSHCVRQRP